MAKHYALLVDDDWEATVYMVMSNGHYINPRPLGPVDLLGLGDVPPDRYLDLEHYQALHAESSLIRLENDATAAQAYDRQCL